MKIEFERVFERDLDLLLMNLFSRGSKACELFFNQIELQPDEITALKHSVKQVHGESDLEIWFTVGGEDYTLFIEDKINAPAQSEQQQRYKERKADYCKQGKIKDGFIFLVAPKDYIGSNGEAKNYDYKVNFDELLPILEEENDSFGCAVLEYGKRKYKDPKTPDKDVTAFWQNYINFFHDRGNFELNDTVKERSANSIWPTFRTDLPGTVIQHKSVVNSRQKGWIDLQFTGKKKQKAKLDELLQEYLDKKQPPMRRHITGNSYSIGIEVDRVCFSESFSKYTKQMNDVYEAVSRLEELATRIAKDEIEIP